MCAVVPKPMSTSIKAASYFTALKLFKTTPYSHVSDMISAFILLLPSPPNPLFSNRPQASFRPPTMVIPKHSPSTHSRSPPSPPTSLFADIDGVSVHHTISPSPCPPSHLICIHGFGASLFSYSYLTPLTKRLPLALLRFDLPGFGRTSRPRSLDCYKPAFCSRIITALSDNYTPSMPYSILAHSMGSLSAVCNVLSSPQRVSALVLIAPALVPTPPFPSFVRLFARVGAEILAWLAVGATFILSPILALILRKYVGSKSFWRTGLSLAREGPLPEEIVDGYFAPTKEKGWDRGVLNFTRAAFLDRARGIAQGEDFIQMLAQLEDRPAVLIIHGDNDRVVPVANSRKLAECLPGSRLVVMKNCGHVPHEEKPDEFSSIVAEFLQAAGVGKEEV